jgi:sialate O-acetylesterase
MKSRRALFLFLLAPLLVTEPAYARARLPAIFGSHMVLQRDKPIKIWGWADPGEKVFVSYAAEWAAKDGDASGGSLAIANKNGEWSVTIRKLPAGAKVTIRIKAGDTKTELKDILVGEVWVCSGQSNMEWSVAASNDAKKEIAAANHPQIRLFHVPRRPAGMPEKDVRAQWAACSPKSIPRFSAVAYFFGRHLQQQLKVPIGLVATSWGGTRIEPWTPVEGFESVEQLKKSADTIKSINASYSKILKSAKSLNQEPPKHPLATHGHPTGLYNGMVAPLVPFAIRGAIWYQGESNRHDGAEYALKMRALINGWRKVWGQGDFPFYYVQLAPYRYGKEDPTILARCWEAQTDVLKMKNTGMAVTVDIGNVGNIHPKNKQDVGKRLALWALAKDYGQKDLVYSGPLYKSMKVESDAIRLSFDHVGAGLVARDGKPLSWFEIAGKDGKFVKADAKIDGGTVIVSSPAVTNPRHVRFAWSMLAEPNLSNKEGLPASPFRTKRAE